MTIFHWDLPQPLQDLGGFSNEIIADFFQDYAEVVFEKFGEKVIVKPFWSHSFAIRKS